LQQRRKKERKGKGKRNFFYLFARNQSRLTKGAEEGKRVWRGKRCDVWRGGMSKKAEEVTTAIIGFRTERRSVKVNSHVYEKKGKMIY
jgi:hypothetical protein